MVQRYSANLMKIHRDRCKIGSYHTKELVLWFAQHTSNEASIPFDQLNSSFNKLIIIKLQIGCVLIFIICIIRIWTSLPKFLDPPLVSQACKSTHAHTIHMWYNKVQCMMQCG